MQQNEDVIIKKGQQSMFVEKHWQESLPPGFCSLWVSEIGSGTAPRSAEQLLGLG
jgi:hypothetical protein